MFKRSRMFESSPDRGGILVEFTEQDKAESGKSCFIKANCVAPDHY